MSSSRLSPADLLQLTRWNTPTVYNGWEQITSRDAAHDCFNLEPVRDYMPQMGVMVGYAVTVVVEPGNPEHKRANPRAAIEWYRYVASQPGPKIVVVQDLDKPVAYGSFWGEVGATAHQALGCIGTIVDGAIRDYDEMQRVGFKALARCTCVGHAHSTPVRWGEEVEVFGCKVKPGQLLHADQHGFLAIPEEDEAALLEAARFMDSLECQTVIQAAYNSAGRSKDEILDRLEAAMADFGRRVRERFPK